MITEKLLNSQQTVGKKSMNASKQIKKTGLTFEFQGKKLDGLKAV